MEIKTEETAKGYRIHIQGKNQKEIINALAKTRIAFKKNNIPLAIPDFIEFIEQVNKPKPKKTVVYVHAKTKRG